MRNTFIKTLEDLASQDPRIILLTGDLGFGVLDSFLKAHPTQFLNAGIAEQNMTGVATGLALEGRIAFTYSIANFPTLRCLEQIRNDAAYHHANVKIVSIGAGMAYGSSGMSHFATEDISIMRALPDVAVFSPGDPVEAEAVTRAIYQYPGTCYLRLGKGGEKRIHNTPLIWEVGQAITLAEEGDVAVFSTGPILDNVTEAVRRLNEMGVRTRQYSFPSIKPLDKSLIQRVAYETTRIVTVEEHNLSGGFGSAVAEVLAEMPCPHAVLRRLGINDRYVSDIGSQTFLRQENHLAPDDIIQAVLNGRSDRDLIPGRQAPSAVMSQSSLAAANRI
jgi:transketolase